MKSKQIISRFFSIGASSARHSVPALHAQRIKTHFGKRWSEMLSPETMEENAKSARVYYNNSYFPPPVSGSSPFSLSRLLAKTAAVSVEGDRDGYFQDGTQFSDPLFFSKLKPGDPKGLSPDERQLAPKKVITSTSSVLGIGGYPLNNPKKDLTTPFRTGVISVVAPQFENLYLQYSLFIMDSHQPNIGSIFFDHLYGKTAKDFQSAQKELGRHEVNNDLLRLRSDFFFIARSKPGYFYSTPFQKNALIFHKSAYFNSLVEDVLLSLATVNNMAEEAGKPAYLKATTVGMGYFARIDGFYDIHSILFPIYLRAFKHVLEHYSFPNIQCIEFPIFEEAMQIHFDLIFENQPAFDNIKIFKSTLDVLDFTDEQKDQYYPCVLSPSDSNSFVGNEWGYGSVESAIGNNTTIRNDQVPFTNPRILEPAQHIGVTMDDSNYTFESSKSLNISNT